MFRLVVIILDHKTSLPFILVNLVVWCNYCRWFMVVYFGWLIPYINRYRMVCFQGGVLGSVSGCHYSHILQVLVHCDINVHFSCLFITSSRTRSFFIVHLTFVSVFYHRKWFGITSLRIFISQYRHLLVRFANVHSLINDRSG